jgi:hypothetical protein
MSVTKRLFLVGLHFKTPLDTSSKRHQSARGRLPDTGSPKKFVSFIN